MKVIIITLVLLSVATSVSSYPWKNCPGQDTSRLEVTDVTVDPVPIPKGKPCKFGVKGNAKDNLNQKNGRMDVYNAGTRFFSTAVGGSYSVSQGGLYDYSLSYTIPSFVPPGEYEVRFSFIDTNGQTFTCTSIIAQF